MATSKCSFPFSLRMSFRMPTTPVIASHDYTPDFLGLVTADLPRLYLTFDLDGSDWKRGFAPRLDGTPWGRTRATKMPVTGDTRSAVDSATGAKQCHCSATPGANPLRCQSCDDHVSAFGTASCQVTGVVVPLHAGKVGCNSHLPRFCVSTCTEAGCLLRDGVGPRPVDLRL